MTSKPHPVAETAALLMQRAAALESVGGDTFFDADYAVSWKASPYAIASLASQLHRLAKQTDRAAEIECNGEFRQGQREVAEHYGTLHRLDTELQAYVDKVDKRVDKLNKWLETGPLAPLGIRLEQSGDPRGFTLAILARDGFPPVPGNSWGGEQAGWGIA